MSTVLTSSARWNEKKSIWQINVQKNKVRKSFYSSTPGRRGKAEAENKAREWLESNNEDDPIFSRAWELYCEDRKLSVGTSGQVSDRCIGNVWLLPALGNKKLSRITIQDWQDILNKAVKEGKAKATVDDIRNRMTGFRKFCKKKRWPVEDMDLLENRSEKRKEHQILSKAEIRQLWSDNTTIYCSAVIRDPFWNAFRLSIIYGCRRGEVCGLQWSDYKGGYLYIRRAINAYNEETDGKNENARRRVKVGAQAKAILDDQKAFLESVGVVSPWIFPNVLTGDFEKPRNLYERWKVYLKYHNMPELTFHETRHTMISQNRSQLPVELLKMVVGQSEDFDTFGIYGHDVEEDFDAASAGIEGIMSSILECGTQRGTESAG